MQKELIKTNEWDKDLFEIIDWNAFGTVFRIMILCDRLKLFKMPHRIPVHTLLVVTP